MGKLLSCLCPWYRSSQGEETVEGIEAPLIKNEHNQPRNQQVAIPFRHAEPGSNQDVEPKAEWYHGHLSHSEARNRCSNRFGEPPGAPDGAYFVCRVGEDYYLYIYYKRAACKFKVLCQENKWRLDSKLNTDLFESLELLIQHHQARPIKLESGKVVKLKVVVKPV